MAGLARAGETHRGSGVMSKPPQANPRGSSSFLSCLGKCIYLLEPQTLHLQKGRTTPMS